MALRGVLIEIYDILARRCYGFEILPLNYSQILNISITLMKSNTLNANQLIRSALNKSPDSVND